MWCGGCGILVGKDTKALQCDRCDTRQSWRCINCLGISQDMYDHLEHSSCLRWFCEQCEHEVMVKREESGSKLDMLMDKMDKVLDVFRVLED